MKYYEAIFDPQDGESVQWLGVYALRWKSEWGEPTVAFREATDIDVMLQAKDGKLEELALAILNAVAFDEGLLQETLERKWLKQAYKLARGIIAECVVPIKEANGGSESK